MQEKQGYFSVPFKKGVLFYSVLVLVCCVQKRILPCFVFADVSERGKGVVVT